MNDFKTTITSRKSKNSCGKSRNFNLESYEYIILLQIIIINNKLKSTYYYIFICNSISIQIFKLKYKLESLYKKNYI